MRKINDDILQIKTKALWLLYSFSEFKEVLKP